MRYTDAIEENGKLMYAPKKRGLKIIIAAVVVTVALVAVAVDVFACKTLRPGLVWCPAPGPITYPKLFGRGKRNSCWGCKKKGGREG